MENDHEGNALINTAFFAEWHHTYFDFSSPYFPYEDEC
jgi:hypothetical protein